MSEEYRLPRRPLGRTGVEVTIFGLGGEGVLRTFGRQREATALIERALALGINYFESARAYAGSESYLGTALGARRRDVFLTSKTAERAAGPALQDLEATLRNLNTDYLDLWQFHDLRDEAEWRRAQRPDGVLAAMRRAQQEGKVRFIGVTGHHDPRLLAQAIAEFDFDTVLLPVSAAESHYRGFLEMTVPAAQQKGMGIVGMKTLARGILVDPARGLTAGKLLQFALSQPVSLVTVGCDDVAQLEENVAAAAAFQPLSEEEKTELLALTRPVARQAVYYRPHAGVRGISP